MAHNIDTSLPPLTTTPGTKIFGMLPTGAVGWMYHDTAAAGLPIGLPGTAGALVGTCPAEKLPPGMTPISGCHDPVGPNKGNYQFSDGSICVFIPKFFYRIGHVDSPRYATYGVNAVDIVGTETFTTRGEAAAAGYALHRAFIDGGVEQVGFFYDKYQSSKNALGTGWVASSIKGGLPLSSHSAHNPVGNLTATSGSNINGSFVTAFKARDGVNGAINPASNWHEASVFQRHAVQLLSMAHAQACTSTANCAWWNATTNYPKGNNNNALRDTADTTVLYESDGYPNAAKCGTGVPFAKTTHNGQESGIADLNGNLWDCLLGMTCIAAGKTITGATQANPCVVTAASHGYTTGKIVMISGVVGMTQINDKMFAITVIDPNTFSLDGVNATGYTAYASGGSAATGTFYVAKESVRMSDFTGGNTLATDHWGATGVAAMMEPINFPLVAAPGGTRVELRYGNGANQVFSGAVSGDGWLLTCCGIPLATGLSSAGTDLFGEDYFYQYVRNELCVLAGGGWSHGSRAGAWARHWFHHRTSADVAIGARAACYPV